MNQYKIAFYNRPFPRIKSYYDLIDITAEYGLPAFEGFNHMELTEPNAEQARRIREYADVKGVVCCCFSVYADIVGENADVEIERMKKFADIAAILGSPYLHHTIAPNAGKDVLSEKFCNTLFYRGVAGVREIFDYAAERNVRGVYEDQAFLFNGIERFARFINTVDRDIGVVADVGNICQMDETIEPFIREFADRIVHVHLKDVKPVGANYTGRLPTRNGRYFAATPIGTGTVNLKTAIHLLREHGYNGYYALEYGAPRDDSDTIDSALAQIRNWISN